MLSATSETYGPRVYFPLIFLQLAISFTVCFAIFTFSLYHKNTKNIILSSLSDLTLQVAVKGLTTPLSRWLQGSYLFV